jgi:hypothetical protein
MDGVRASFSEGVLKVELPKQQATPVDEDDSGHPVEITVDEQSEKRKEEKVAAAAAAKL